MLENLSAFFLHPSPRSSLLELRVLRLFGNPLEFFPEILPCQSLRHLSLANVRIISDMRLKHVDVTIEVGAAWLGSAETHSLKARFSVVGFSCKLTVCSELSH